MNISIIVAKSTNNVIGKDNALPWHLSSDLKHFKSITMGKPIVMGRKTHESIGRPLPGRENIILTRDTAFSAEGCKLIHSVDELELYCKNKDEVMIMGGATLYKEFLHHANKLYITEVHAEVEGDTWFPDFDRESWIEVSRQDFHADEKNNHDYSFLILEKITE